MAAHSPEHTGDSCSPTWAQTSHGTPQHAQRWACGRCWWWHCQLLVASGRALALHVCAPGTEDGCWGGMGRHRGPRACPHPAQPLPSMPHLLTQPLVLHLQNLVLHRLRDVGHEPGGNELDAQGHVLGAAQERPSTVRCQLAFGGSGPGRRTGERTARTHSEASPGSGSPQRG